MGTLNLGGDNEEIRAMVERRKAVLDHKANLEEDWCILGAHPKWTVGLRGMPNWGFMPYRDRLEHIMQISHSYPSPLTDDQIENCIRAGFRLIPLAKDENYTVDEVVEMAIGDREHLDPWSRCSFKDKALLWLKAFTDFKQWSAVHCLLMGGTIGLLVVQIFIAIL